MYRPHRRCVPSVALGLGLMASVIAWLGVPMLCCAQEGTVQDRIDWPSFMSRQDLVWDSLPRAWHEGAFVGNGLVGAMIYQDTAGPLRWDLGRSDVCEHQPKGNHRLQIGEMLLNPVGKIQSGTMRLDLWNAEADGKLTTDRGTITFHCLAHAQRNVVLVDLQTTGDESECAWSWRPGLPVNPRLVYQKQPVNNPNPEAREETVGETLVWIQPRTSGGEYAVAWRDVVLGPGHRLRVISLGDSFPQVGGAQEAVKAVDEAAQLGLEALAKTHREWWHAYYPQSFVSVPDARVESFYWIQMYKLASATRADRPAIDLMGPWFRTTPWPAIWWNLNLQLTYWPVYTANRLEIGESLCRMMDAGFDNLIKNAPEAMRGDSAAVGRVTTYDCLGSVGDERGNLTWACHNYWLQCRYAGDDERLRTHLFPLLKRAVGYYLHLLQEGPDGYLHLPVSVSPEYPQKAADTNYDLSLLRWGLTTLIETSRRLKLDDPLVPRWTEVLQRLTPYPTDANGLMIGKEVPFAQSHRHFSHLLMVYPLRLVTWEQPESQKLIETSLRHWIGFEGALQGYSFTGAAGIAAEMGRGEEAAGYLGKFLDRYVKPNTMYLEAGPVIETPLSAAQALHELLLQSWGGVLRVFPAAPDSWPDLTFHRLRGEGAFLVSASRQGGKTQWVQVESLKGEPCRLKADLAGPVQVQGPAAGKAKDLGAGMWELALGAGESVTLRAAGSAEACEVAPVAHDAATMNPYGSPRKPPVPQSADGSLDLHAARATLHGSALFYEKTATLDDIGHWVDAADWVSWDVVVQRPGTFELSAAYSSPSSGRTFAVEVGGQQLIGEVQSTGSWNTFQEYKLGTVALTTPGKVTIKVRAVKLPGGGLMNLQRLRLVPVAG
ncbi:MAG: glycoside hydrolase family 95-like protein [Armatimonadia bacterium]